LGDFYYVDDPALLYNSFTNIQEKTRCLEKVAAFYTRFSSLKTSAIELKLKHNDGANWSPLDNPT